MAKQENGASYFQHRIKCMACGLHYVVCSDFAEWPLQGTTRDMKIGEATGIVWCPECGVPGKKLVYGPVETKGFIFQIVPGRQEDGSDVGIKSFGG